MRPTRAATHECNIAVGSAGDGAGVCRLFQRVFHREKSIEHWRWQFADNPAGQHVLVARDSSDRIVGHFAGVPARTSIDGASRLFGLIVDSMVDVCQRTGLKKPGLFTRLAREYVERFGRSDHEVVSFGLPNREALRVGQRLLQYSALRDVRHLARRLDAPLDEVDHSLRVHVSAEPHEQHNGVWRRHCARASILTVRDRERWQWRYVDCPIRQYRFVHVERNGVLAASLVFTHEHFVPETGSLVDLISVGDPVALAAGVTRVEELARSSGHDHVATFLPEHACESKVFEALGYARYPSGYTLVGRSHDPLLPVSRLRDEWWYTLGDFDLV